MGSLSVAETTIQSPEFRQILGVRFFVGGAQRAIDLLARGGLLVVPAAPALKNLSIDSAYREALLQADLAIADSSLMVMLWNLIQKDNVRRLSGLEYLAELLTRSDVREPGGTFWIMASEASAATNLAWLRQHGIEALPEDVYLAPMYRDKIEDEALLRHDPGTASPAHHRHPRRWHPGEAGFLPQTKSTASAGHSLHWRSNRFSQRRPGPHPDVGRPFLSRLALSMSFRTQALCAEILVGTRASRLHASLPGSAAGDVVTEP